MAGKTPDRGGPGSRQPALACAEWEALLVDALDGALTPKDAAAFEAHRETCLACAQLLEETRRGREWLHFLEEEPEVPQDLVGRILAQTSGAAESFPLPAVADGLPIAPAVSWQQGWLPKMERHAAQSRWMMTAAMAFFSIAFTLNLTGVKLSGFRLSDLKPTTIASALTRQFYVADAHVMRYYDNLRFVYELESRVRQIRRDNAPQDNDGKTPAPANPNRQTQPSQPQKKQGGGTAEKTSPKSEDAPAAAPVDPPSFETTQASFHLRGYHHKHFTPDEHGTASPLRTSKPASGPCTMNHKSKTIDRAERSLA